MRFKQKLKPAILIKRYKRFLADVELPDKKVITVHCPNSGSMLGCSEPGSPVMISSSDNPGRKYPHTLELVQTGSFWVGVNTARTNKLVQEALEKGVVKELGDLDSITREIKTSAHTRLDFLLEREDKRIYMEVKNCSLAENRTAMFPDAITKRGAKHLMELAALKKQGHAAVVFFCVQRQDADRFIPAHHIDPVYSETLAAVASEGVIILAYRADVNPGGITITRKLPVQLTP
ncbi:MAG: DNA/RNA nuclease SfsA [Deltaproteobacteria bacterium]|jgi:sugar fermentation stimulation protein A|nr:DNA/RNA nuclease SfsA [Deltaproteobacteria bacterium]